MRFYAESPLRAAAQALVDLLALVWAGIVAWGAKYLHDTLLEWQTLGQDLVQAGQELEGTFSEAAGTAKNLPFVGDALAGGLGKGSDAGRLLSAAGYSQIEAVGYGAVLVPGLIAVVALMPSLWWLARRLRYAKAAGQAMVMRANAPDLLALHALTGRSYRRLKRISANPAAAWRNGDQKTIEGLATIQLSSLGLKPGQW